MLLSDWAQDSDILVAHGRVAGGPLHGLASWLLKGHIVDSLQRRKVPLALIYTYLGR
jgi:hypothetical protein